MNDTVRCGVSLMFAAVFIGFSPLDKPGGLVVAGIGTAIACGFALFFYFRGRND